MIIKGSVRKFPDAIDTDSIIPGRYLSSRDPLFLGSKCMEPIDPDFPNRISRGDVIVAGKNFGCGSSREHAVLALMGAGIACVVAKSYARVFFRNAINLGLPIVVCPEAVDMAAESDAIEVDLQRALVGVHGGLFATEPFPAFLQEIVRLGGLVPYVRKQLGIDA